MLEEIKKLWGGKRAGAGRKPSGLTRKWVSLPDEIWDKVTPLDVQNIIIEYFSEKNEEKQDDKVISSGKIILTPDQKAVLKAMLSGSDVFVSGGAGVGKSVLIRSFADKYKGNLVLCAPTGVASVNISGSTLHSVFGLPVKDVFMESDIQEIYNTVYNYDPETSQKNRRLDVLLAADCFIIDEISMCRGDVFAMVMASIKALRDKGKKVQLIVVGDFYQLPPVLTGKKSFTVKKSNGEIEKISQKDQYKKIYGNDSGFCFLDSGWNFEKCILFQVMRQVDNKFSDSLNLIRTGDKKGLDYIYENSSRVPLDAIWICGTNKDADERNVRELNKIKGKKYSFPIEYDIIDSNAIDYSELRDIALKTAKGDLEIKKGCSVVALVNSYDENGNMLFCNGSRGKVIKIDEDEKKVFVDFGNGVVPVPVYTWEEKRYYLNEKTIKTDTKTVATFKKIPLVLGYATTVHKSQGQTLDAINVDRNCNWLPGQLYVALSRAKDVKKIYVEGKPVPLVSQEVVKFYNEN